MAAKTPTARRRASFARAERINRTNGTANTQPRKVTGRIQSQKPVQPPTREQKPSQPSNSAAAKRSAKSDGATRRPTSLDVVTKRVQQARQATEQRRHRQLREQTRQTFTRAAERRRDEQKRTEFARRREVMQANLKRAQEVRKRTEQRQRQQLQDRTRQTFNTQAGNRSDRERQTLAKEAQRKAAIDIDRDNKQRQADQQTAHRYQTGQVRQRHQAEMQSHRRNDAVGIAGHAQRIKTIDANERRSLDALARQRNTVAGRLANIVRPGQYHRETISIGATHEHERWRQHCKQEALKERQHQAMQTARLRQAHERLHVFAEHRAERQQLLDQQRLNMPRMIEDRQRALIEVERQRTLEHERTNDRQHTEDRSWHIPAKVY